MPPVKIIHTRDYDLFCQGQLADPYPVLRELRNTEPVHWCEPWGCWIVTSYDDVQQGHLHSRLSSDKARITMNALPGELRIRVDGLGKHLALWVSHTDPPGHKRLRESVQQPFVAIMSRADSYCGDRSRLDRCCCAEGPAGCHLWLCFSSDGNGDL